MNPSVMRVANVKYMLYECLRSAIHVYAGLENNRRLAKRDLADLSL